MRIAWFTPFCRSSAIGRFSMGVVRELSKRAAVDVWHPVTNEPLEVAARTVRLAADRHVRARDLDGYDLVVYNLGNHLAFHRQILETARRLPGICVLHDFVMQHFFLAYYLEHLRQPQLYVAAMKRRYGETGSKLASEIVGGRAGAFLSSDLVLKFPLLEEAVSNAYGVVVHSRFAENLITASYPGPVAVLDLSYEPRVEEGAGPRAELGVPDGKLLLVTVGHVNQNKLVLEVLRVFAQEQALARKVIYAVVGPVEPTYGAQLREFIARRGLTEIVRLEGYVEQGRLNGYLAHADICLNLRWPVTEGASASLIEEMWYGNPVIVCNAGWYSELPDDCVVKIAPQQLEQELPTVLKELVEDCELRLSIGHRARAVAEARFRSSTYAAKFLRFAHLVRGAKPLWELADRVAAELSVIGVTPEMKILDSVAQECATLFGDSKQP